VLLPVAFILGQVDNPDGMAAPRYAYRHNCGYGLQPGLRFGYENAVHIKLILVYMIIPCHYPV
jgi:hypothetical protein